MKDLLAIVLFLLLTACQYDPHAHTYTTHKPSIEEITGEYELSEIYMERYSPGIRDKIKTLQEPPFIRITADGRFKAIRFPYFSEVREGFEYRFENFRNVEGRWEIAVVGGIGDGSGTIKGHYGIRLAGLPVHLSSLGFTGTKRIDGLILGFGDPDSGDAIMFKKKNTEQGRGTNAQQRVVQRLKTIPPNP